MTRPNYTNDDVSPDFNVTTMVRRKWNGNSSLWCHTLIVLYNLYINERFAKKGCSISLSPTFTINITSVIEDFLIRIANWQVLISLWNVLLLCLLQWCVWFSSVHNNSLGPCFLAQMGYKPDKLIRFQSTAYLWFPVSLMKQNQSKSNIKTVLTRIYLVSIYFYIFYYYYIVQYKLSRWHTRVSEVDN